MGEIKEAVEEARERECEAGHSPSPSAEVKIVLISTSTPPICLQDLVLN
jgi:hypothetical protein